MDSGSIKPIVQSAGGCRALLTGRWRYSSYAAAVIAMVLFAVVIVPGQVVHRARTDYSWDDHLPPQYEHGWPLTYLIRKEKGDLGWGGFRYAPPTITRCWQFWDLREQHEFHIALLLVDILVGVAIAFIAGLVLEVWRRRHRSVWQIHLLDVGLGVAALAGLIGWYASARSQYFREEAALSITSDVATKSRSPKSLLQNVVEEGVDVRSREEGGPTWLRLSLGDTPFRVFDRVIDTRCLSDDGVARLREFRDLRRTSVVIANSDDLATLSRFQQLEALSLHYDVTGEAPVDLPELPRLKILALSGTYAPLGLDRYRNLESLHLSDHLISGETIREIGTLHGLRQLTLRNCRLTAEETQHLWSLPRLEYLNLDKTDIDDSFLATIAEMRSLRGLSINGTDITDAGLPAVCELAGLEELSVCDTTITDDGLRSLVAMPGLIRINVTRTAVSDAGVVHLLRAPNLRLIRGSFSEAAVARLKRDYSHVLKHVDKEFVSLKRDE